MPIDPALCIRARSNRGKMGGSYEIILTNGQRLCVGDVAVQGSNTAFYSLCLYSETLDMNGKQQSMISTKTKVCPKGKIRTGEENIAVFEDLAVKLGLMHATQCDLFSPILQ